MGVPALALLLLTVMVVMLNGSPASPSARSVTSEPAGNAGVARQLADESGTISFVPATAPPAPAPAAVASGPPLAPHEVLGFAPYWTLGDAGSFPVSELTTIAYFGVDVNGNGTLAESGAGWNGLGSQDLADLVTAAHADSHRVVLTLTCFDQSALNALAAQPQDTARTLAAQVVPLLQAERLDGVNLDFEGTGSGDRSGLDAWVATFAAALRAADPSWQLTMDTYASSAGDPDGFFDIAGLAPSVDAFFVMAYDMGSQSSPSPTAPLDAGGFSDAEALDQYLQVVPTGKVILGIPTYGYDWPTAGPGLGAAATGPPTPVTYAQVAGGDVTAYWDPTTQTPWAQYQQGSQWYEVFFDDPASVALKAQLAAADHLAGVGEWALGFDGGSPTMAAALLGQAVAQTLPVGPAASPDAAEPPASSAASPGSASTPAAPSAPIPAAPAVAGTSGTVSSTGGSPAGSGSSIGSSSTGGSPAGSGGGSGSGGSASGSGGSAAGSGSTGTSGSSGDPLSGILGKL